MKILLGQLLATKNISVYALSKSTDISEHNLANLIKGRTKSVRFDTLQKICEELSCGLNDILELDD